MHNCGNCTSTCEEKRTPEVIPYIAHEAAMDRTERHTKRWMIAFFVALAIFFATNTGWIIYESQFETYYYEQDGAAVNNMNVDVQGDVYDGAATESQEETGQLG